MTMMLCRWCGLEIRQEGQVDDAWVIALRQHWLNSLECLHIVRSDISYCACGWKSGIQPTVGYAVERWIEHVRETMMVQGEVWVSGPDDREKMMCPDNQHQHEPETEQ